MRQTVGEKQMFLVQAKSYKTISGLVWAAMLCYSRTKTRSRIYSAIVGFPVRQFMSVRFRLKLVRRIGRVLESWLIRQKSRDIKADEPLSTM